MGKIKPHHRFYKAAMYDLILCYNELGRRADVIRALNWLRADDQDFSNLVLP